MTSERFFLEKMSAIDFSRAESQDRGILGFCCDQVGACAAQVYFILNPFHSIRDSRRKVCGRKRREISPAIAVLDGCRERTSGLKSKEAKAFNNQMNELRDFLGLADRLMERVARSDKGFAMKWAAKLLS